jgi:hypothetical protein
MAIPVIPILLVSAVGLGALLLAKKSFGASTSLPANAYKVLSRTEVAAMGLKGKVTYTDPSTGKTVPAGDPLFDAAMAKKTRVGSIVFLILKPSTPGHVVGAATKVNQILPNPGGPSGPSGAVYRGTIEEAMDFTTQVKAFEMHALSGPLIGSSVGFTAKDIFDVMDDAKSVGDRGHVLNSLADSVRSTLGTV